MGIGEWGEGIEKSLPCLPCPPCPPCPPKDAPSRLFKSNFLGVDSDLKQSTENIADKNGISNKNDRENPFR
jgi:hypothetical protein